jgi:AhpD family alkylhydroperoxidase
VKEDKLESERLTEIQELMKYLSTRAEESMSSYGGFIASIQKDGILSLKVKELIAIALSISSQCEWCIPYHVKMALEYGATEKEIIEAGMIAVLMCGSPALMHMIPLKRALDEFRK